MVRALPTFASQFLLLSLLSFFILPILSSAINRDSFVRAMDPNRMKKQKLGHFRFYWHDIVSGQNPTSIPIVQPPINTSATAFGLTRIIDNPLTLGPKLSSKIVGRAQGFYASASQQEISLIMVMNFEFTEGKYNGSTITVLGRNPVLEKLREMPVIGGSGVLRFARGYAQATTSKANWKSGDAIVEYNVFVSHY